MVPPDQELLARIAAYPHLPTPPPVALKVIQRTSQPDCEIHEIQEIISLDPGLCGQVLRAVNSAMFALQRPIGSIDRALHFLGLKSVRSLVLTLSLPTMQMQTSTDPRLREFWRTSVAGAIIAHELAVKLGRPDAEDDMVAALLSDLGVFVLQQIFPTDYAPIVGQPLPVLAQRQCEMEEQALGLNHAEVSALVLRQWRLPEDITEAVRYHHRPRQVPSGNRDLVERSQLLYVAGRMAQLQICPELQPMLLQEILELTCEQFRLSEQRFLEFLEPLTRKIEDFASLLDLDIGLVPNYTTLVANATVELIQLTLENAAATMKEQRARPGGRPPDAALAPAGSTSCGARPPATG